MTFRTFRMLMIGVGLCFAVAAFFEAELRSRVVLGLIGGILLLTSWRVTTVLVDPSSDASLLEGLESAIVSVGPQQKVVYANPQARALFGYTGPSGVTLNHMTLTPELNHLTQDARKTRALQQSELVLTGIPARTVVARAWFIAATNLVHLELQDVTQLRHLERVRKDFVANVSHELRTPLTSIRAMAEIISDSDADDLESTQRYGGKIMGEVDRLTLIVSDLLTLSTAESREAAREVCDAADMANDAVERVRKKAADKGLELLAELPESLEVFADPTQLSQVILNLLENAVNYTSEGHVRIVMSGEGSDLTFRVEDTGIGISPEHLPRLFERFYRVDKGRSRATGGTGLGLSIVKHIVEAHGGTITATSKPGEGSTFSVRMPLNMLDKFVSN